MSLDRCVGRMGEEQEAQEEAAGDTTASLGISVTCVRVGYRHTHSRTRRTHCVCVIKSRWLKLKLNDEIKRATFSTRREDKINIRRQRGWTFLFGLLQQLLSLMMRRTLRMIWEEKRRKRRQIKRKTARQRGRERSIIWLYCSDCKWKDKLNVIFFASLSLSFFSVAFWGKCKCESRWMWFMWRSRRKRATIKVAEREEGAIDEHFHANVTRLTLEMLPIDLTYYVSCP